jgi:hypothetical protein
MSRTDSPAERALRRMLEADQVKDTGRGNGAWEEWQRAAADYWVLLHPELARLRRGDPGRVPTVGEMRERAESVARAMEGVPETWRVAPSSAQRAEHLARVGWFHEQMAGLFGPVQDATDRVRRGDTSGVETLVRFLEADIYCFRSGYMKAEVIDVLKRADLDETAAGRLRAVVLSVVSGYDRREFRAYIRLARRVDSEALREDLRALAASPSRRSARHARWVLTGLGEKTSGSGSIP